MLEINFESKATKVFYDFIANHVIMAVRDNQDQILWFAAHFPAGSDDKVNMYCYSIVSLHEFKKFKLKEDQFIYLGEL